MEFIPRFFKDVKNEAPGIPQRNMSFQVELHFFEKEPQRSKLMTSFEKKIFE